jgi:hypothetical protein
MQTGFARTISTIGFTSPGDRGDSFDAVLIQNKLVVTTCLDGRSERTRWLAREADIEDADRFEALVEASDVLPLAGTL